MAGKAQGAGLDAFRLASAGEARSGRVDPATLPRLADRVSGPGASVAWTIRGDADAEGRPALTVTIDGSVPLTCQRCLGPVSVAVAQSTLLLLARGEAELVRLDEASEHEVVDASLPLDPLALVEDELLLTLPFAPRHEYECASPARVASI